jgi:hypothetical protein
MAALTVFKSVIKVLALSLLTVVRLRGVGHLVVQVVLMLAMAVEMVAVAPTMFIRAAVVLVDTLAMAGKVARMQVLVNQVLVVAVVGAEAVNTALLEALAVAV